MDAIYARKSTEDQSRFSIDDQIEKGKTKSGRIDVKIYIDDGFSGEFLDRPALNRLRQDIKDGIITRVICLDPDRLSRKLMNQLLITDEFDRRGVPIVFVNGEYAKTPEGQLFYSMRGAIAEFEKAKINERMSSGRKQKARKGKVVRDYQVYGYDYDQDDEIFVRNEDEARIVELIFDLFTRPSDLKFKDGKPIQGMNGIAKYLTERGVPTKRGAKLWHRQVVRQILLNRSYIGEFYQNRWNTEGSLANKHLPLEDRKPTMERPKEEWILIEIPPIISRDQFEYAQKMISESKRRFAAATSKVKYLLSGLVRCGHCNNTMPGRNARWGKGNLKQYNDRKNTAGAKHPGCGNWARCEVVDKYVWDTVKSWLNQPDEIAAATPENASTESFEQAEIVRVEKELEKTKNGRKRLIGLFADGDFDLGELEVREKLKDLKEKEETLSRRLEELRQSIISANTYESSRQLIKEAAEYYLQSGRDDMSFEAKQHLIRMIVREVRVFNERVEIYTF